MQHRTSSASVFAQRSRSSVRTSGYASIGNYTDGNGVDWVISDNGCGLFDVISCSTQDYYNRYKATQRVARYSQIEHPTFGAMDVAFTARDEDAVKVLVDKFAASHNPESGAVHEGKESADGTALDVYSVPPVDVTPPAGAAPSYSAAAPSGVATDGSFANIQRALLRLGYSVGPTGADGKPGPKTSAAIVKFKSEHGLPADDVVDAAFRKALTDAQQPGASSGSLVPMAIGAAAGGGLAIFLGLSTLVITASALAGAVAVPVVVRLVRK